MAIAGLKLFRRSPLRLSLVGNALTMLDVGRKVHTDIVSSLRKFVFIQDFGDN